MPRALWKGALTFGLVNIPVEVYPAEEKKEFKFSMLDKRDFSPVGYKRYSKESGKEVEWANVVKGYEYEKGQYVVLSDEDFKRANVKASQTIDILAFVPDGEIPYEFFETPYYLAPSGKGPKVYALLRETLRATKRIAIATVVIRTTQHLAAVSVNGKMLMMNTLRFPDELRDAKGFEVPAENLKSAGVSPKEIELAKRLIDDMTEHWKPSEYHNTYHEDLMARIEEKIRGGETHEITKPDSGEKEARPSAKIIDLAELLKQSLGGKGKGATKGEARAKGGAKAAANDDEAGEAEDAGEKKPKTKRRTAASAATPIRLTRKPKAGSGTASARPKSVAKPAAKRKRA